MIPSRTDPGRLLAILALATLAIAQTVIGLRIAASTNHDTDKFDQGAYVAMSQEMSAALYPAVTDGTRNPLFPWLAARLPVAQALPPHTVSHNNDTAAVSEFFEAGKRLNIFLAAAGAFIIGLAAMGHLGGLAAWNLSALSGLGCLIPIGTFFGAEVLFYLFFLGLWIGGFAFLKSPRAGIAVLTGLSGGLAYLAKPSTAPFLALLFVTVVLLAFAARWWRRCPPWLLPPGWLPVRALGGLCLIAAVYFAVIAPRMAFAERTFGSPLYSLPSFWFWADSWEDCVNKYANCTDYALAKLPPHEHPTAANFFRRHSLAHALERGLGGTAIKLRQLFDPDQKAFWKAEKSGKARSFVLPARGDLLAGLGLLAIGLAAMGRMEFFLRPGLLVASLLAAAAFGLYTAAYGWYHVIGPGFRFVMMFYIPLAWSFLSTARSAANGLRGGAIFAAANGIVTVLLLWRLAELFTDAGFQKVAYAF